MSLLGDAIIADDKSIMQGRIKTDLVPTSIASSFNPRTGGTTIVSYAGPRDQIKQLASQCQADGYEYRLTPGNKWTIEITFPLDIIVNEFGQEPPCQTIWEMSNHQVEKNLFDCNDRPFISVLSTNSKAMIEAKLKDDKSVDVPVEDTQIQYWPNAMLLYNLKRAGVEGKPMYVTTLKRTVIVPNNDGLGTTRWDSTKDWTLFTADELVNYYSRDYTLNEMPEILARIMPISLPIWNKGRNGFDNVMGYYLDPATQIVSFVGYLQFPAEYQTVSTTKVSISQQFVFNQWVAGPYGMFDTAFNHTSPVPDLTGLGLGGAPICV